jgi:uncharacterized repeat protein (TIGR02059 family)
VEKAHGSGTVHHLAFAVGLAGWQSDPHAVRPPAAGDYSSYPDAYSDVQRDWLARICAAAGVRRPFEVGGDKGDVESPVLESSAGLAVVLCNWTNAAKGPTTCFVRTDRTLTSATSYKHATLTLTPTAGGYTVTLPSIDTSGDVLRLHGRSVPDAVPPTVASRKVNAVSLVIAYNETLDAASVPSDRAFTIVVNGSEREVSTVAASGSTVTLTLATPVRNGDAVVASYAVPEKHPIRDAALNAAAAYVDQPVTNDTPPDTGLVESWGFIPI